MDEVMRKTQKADEASKKAKLALIPKTEQVLICPYCGCENYGYEDEMGDCCGEIGQCEWEEREIV